VTRVQVFAIVRHVVLLTLVLSTTASLTGQDRAPIPSDAEQTKALELVREVYGEQWEDAETSDEKQALADRLMQQAGSSATLTNCYMLLKVAGDIASKAGDVKTAFRVIEQTARQFDIDEYRAKGRAVSQAAKTAKSREQHQVITDSSLALIGEAVDRDDFVAARYLAKIAVDTARKARDANRLKRATAIDEEVAEIARAYEEIADSLTRLREKPVDPEANSAVGEYLCFMKGDWEKDLPMLALGADSKSRELASLALEEPLASEDQVKLGDGWWELAQQEEGTRKQRLAERAGHRYRKSLSAVTALVKGKVEKRLEETDQIGRPMLGSTGRPELSDDDPPPKITLSAASMQRNRKVAQWVLQIGGKVVVRTLDGEKLDISAQNIAEFPNKPFAVEDIYLFQNKVITDGALTNLTRLVHLKTLNVADTKTTDAGLPFVGRLRSLEYLYLGGTRVSDKGMPFLSSLTNMRLLGLNFTKVTDAGMPYLRRMTKQRDHHAAAV